MLSSEMYPRGFLRISQHSCFVCYTNTYYYTTFLKFTIYCVNIDTDLLNLIFNHFQFVIFYMPRILNFLINTGHQKQNCNISVPSRETYFVRKNFKLCTWYFTALILSHVFISFLTISGTAYQSDCLITMSRSVSRVSKVYRNQLDCLEPSLLYKWHKNKYDWWSCVCIADRISQIVNGIWFAFEFNSEISVFCLLNYSTDYPIRMEFYQLSIV